MNINMMYVVVEWQDEHYPLLDGVVCLSTTFEEAINFIEARKQLLSNPKKNFSIQVHPVTR